VELTDYWRTVRRRWRVVAVCFVTAMIGAALLTWQSTPQYSSSTRLFVSTSESDSSAAYTGNLFASQRVTSYADLVTSRQLGERVSAALTQSTDPDELREQVQAVPETVILEISATDPDPVMARDIAQAYAEELTRLVEDLETRKGSDNALIKATIVDDAQESSDPISPSHCATSDSRESCGSSSDSGWRWLASSSTAPSPPATRSRQ